MRILILPQLQSSFLQSADGLGQHVHIKRCRVLVTVNLGKDQ